MIRIAWITFWVACIVLVGLSARPYAGSWNDGSRLAAVEAIVDHDTLAIDDSIFVRVPLGSKPYVDAGCLVRGTCDKLLIDGHFYSDKPAVISFLMAGLYQSWRWVSGPAFAERPELVCRVMTWGTSGVAFLITLLCINALGARLGLSSLHRLLLCASLAMATIAPIYLQHVNSHILLLAVSAALMWQMITFAQEQEVGVSATWRLVAIGCFAGVGYVLDLGLGPVLLASIALAVFVRTRSVRPLAWVLMGALPWLIAHHALNYAIGGTFKPMNTVPEYSAWEGSPFDPSNLTGLSRHSTDKLIVYSAALLYGKHGFIGHNLPLLLALGAVVVAWRTARSHRPEILFAITWCVGGWLMYAVFSNNYGGVCCSIRWFVPFLAPSYYILALLLQNRPSFAWDLLVLSAWGFALVALLMSSGPWSNRMLIAFWPIQVCAFVSWWMCRRWRQRIEYQPRESMNRVSARAA